MKMIEELGIQLREKLAIALNETAEIVLNDIQQHVQVRSGRLRDSYGIVQRATPERLQIGIDSPLAYKTRHYPPVRPEIPRERNRALQGDPMFPANGSIEQLEWVLRERLERVGLGQELR